MKQAKNKIVIMAETLDEHRPLQSDVPRPLLLRGVFYIFIVFFFFNKLF